MYSSSLSDRDSLYTLLQDHTQTFLSLLSSSMDPVCTLPFKPRKFSCPVLFRRELIKAEKMWRKSQFKTDLVAYHTLLSEFPSSAQTNFYKEKLVFIFLSLQDWTTTSARPASAAHLTSAAASKLSLFLTPHNFHWSSIAIFTFLQHALHHNKWMSLLRLDSTWCQALQKDLHLYGKLSGELLVGIFVVYCILNCCYCC